MTAHLCHFQPYSVQPAFANVLLASSTARRDLSAIPRLSWTTMLHAFADQTTPWIAVNS